MTEPNSSASRLCISPEALVLPTAVLVGCVEVGEYSSIWYGCVLRGDINAVRVGRYTNVQDLSVLHVDNAHPCEVGDFVTVGHRTVLHGCRIEDEALIGMGAVVLSGAVIGKRSIVGAGSLVREGTEVRPGMLAVGNPARVIRKLRRGEVPGRALARKYAQVARNHLRGHYQIHPVKGP